jgi:hypothetical protein
VVDRISAPSDAFEKELREQLQARPAPPGFADRVMARVSARRRPRLLWQPMWRWAAVAAVLAVTVLGGMEHERQQRIAGERAREQVLLALRITGTTLHQVQNKVNQGNSGAQDSDAQPKHTIDIAP